MKKINNNYLKRFLDTSIYKVTQHQQSVKDVLENTT